MCVWGGEMPEVRDWQRLTFGKGMGLAGLLVLSLSVSACQNKGAGLTDPMSTGSTGKAGEPSFKRTEQLAKAFHDNPADTEAGLAFANGLGQLGQNDTQIDVLRQVADQNPKNAAIQAQVGKKFLAVGETQLAAEILQRAVMLNPQDWQSASALGTALDQLRRHAEARTMYQSALAKKPGEVSIMNNIGMSFALQGKLPEAEKQLREAMAAPGAAAFPRIRQNLALVVGLQGRFEESKQIASQDLPPDQVQANLDFLQKMLAKPNTWAQLQNNG
jgi:Flp pilus assembly protein TadD